MENYDKMCIRQRTDCTLSHFIACMIFHTYFLAHHSLICYYYYLFKSTPCLLQSNVSLHANSLFASKLSFSPFVFPKSIRSTYICKSNLKFCYRHRTRVGLFVSFSFSQFSVDFLFT